jgi:hypothetical protein
LAAFFSFFPFFFFSFLTGAAASPSCGVTAASSADIPFVHLERQISFKSIKLRLYHRIGAE